MRVALPFGLLFDTAKDAPESFPAGTRQRMWVTSSGVARRWPIRSVPSCPQVRPPSTETS